jgi:ATP-dependent helicase/nuclease subunit B
MKPTACEIVVSPRASDRVRAARSFLEALPADAEALVVAPTREAADDLVREVSRAQGARFGVHRLTLNRLAGMLASERMLEAQAAPAAGLAMEAVAARVVHRLKGGGALEYFEPVIDRPGFPGALARTIGELRMAGVAPDQLRKKGGAADALANALDEFEAELRNARLADRALVLRFAIEALGASRAPRFAGIPCVLFDLAVETALEAALIAALAARAPRTLATIPTGDAVSESFLTDALRAAPKAAVGEAKDSLQRLQDHLFADTAPTETPLDGTVAVVSAPGEMHEAVEIARRIHFEAREGVPFDRIAVLCHAGERYGPYLEEALHRAGIPAYFATGTRRPEPGGRALLALLSCASENLSASRFAEYLSLAQVPDPDATSEAEFVPPSADLFSSPLAADLAIAPAVPETEPAALSPVPVVEGTVRAPWRWEKLLVEAAVIGSRDRWERRLNGLANDLRERRDETEEEHRRAAIDRQIVDIEHLRNVAMPIIDRLAARPAAATWSEWLDYLRALTAAAVRDRAPVLAALAELEPMGPVGPLGLDEVRVVLAERLGSLEAPPASRRYGKIFVAPPVYARGMQFDVVIVPGLAERTFPKKLIEDPILSDAVRRQVSEDLRIQEDRAGAERLALRMAAGAAVKRAMFSYPRVDLDQGRPRVPSFYALELLRAAEGRLPGFDELARRAACEQATRLGWPAPGNPADAIDTAEFDLAVLNKLVDKDPAETIGAAHYLLNEESNRHLPRALRARARRWFWNWTSADGLVNPEPGAIAALARHQLSRRPYSPTALQHYAACPYRFMLQAIFRLEPREEAIAIEVIDPLTRGSMTHEIQFEVLSQLKRENALPITPQTLEMAQRALDRVVDATADKWHDQLAPAIDRVWRDGIDGIRADLREWLRLASEDPEGWRPERFELAFGLSGREQADAASSAEPVTVEGGLQLRGSIDLVERDRAGRLRVTDYKTGKVRAEKNFIIGGGKTLQPVLYALAARAVLKEEIAAGRLYYCTATGGYQERVITIDDRARAAAKVLTDTISDALEKGFLPAAPAEDECRWCNYRRVCGPYEEQRVMIKPGGIDPDQRSNRARRPPNWEKSAEKMKALWELRNQP